MQKIGCYLFERRDGMDSETARRAEVQRIEQEISKWLQSKGGSDRSPAQYLPEDGSTGTVSRERANDDQRSWSLVRLDELTSGGRRFVASISVTSTTKSVAIYVTLEVGADGSFIKPIDIDPRCPKIVRSLIDMPGKWYHGSSQIRKNVQVKGFEQGEVLACEIAELTRSVPIVVVSQVNGEVALPSLDEKLAYDLIGLANVAVVDFDGAWALTDHLGKAFSCYEGAVRLYWPRFSKNDDPFRSPLWTATRLRSTDLAPVEIRDRLRNQLRTRLLRAAALSVVRPTEIDDIRGVANRRVFADMQARANSLEDFRKIADSYAAENDALRKQSSDLQQRADELETQLAEFESLHGALLARIENAELQLRYRETADKEVPPDRDLDGRVANTPPCDGEVRFYKKHFSAPGHDIMNRVDDCGCNNWESANKADKARKGICRLECRNEFKSMHHCSSCGGGGMWKVKW